MVFTTLTNYIVRHSINVVNNSPTKFWKRRKIFRLSAFYYGRSRNIYSLAIRKLHHALVRMTGQEERREARMDAFYTRRVDGACNELGTNKDIVMEGLIRANVYLDAKMLSQLAIYEPRTFKALVKIGVAKCNVDPPRKANFQIPAMPDGVITRGML